MNTGQLNFFNRLKQNKQLILPHQPIYVSQAENQRESWYFTSKDYMTLKKKKQNTQFKRFIGVGQNQRNKSVSYDKTTQQQAQGSLAQNKESLFIMVKQNGKYISDKIKHVLSNHNNKSCDQDSLFDQNQQIMRSSLTNAYKCEACKLYEKTDYAIFLADGRELKRQYKSQPSFKANQFIQKVMRNQYQYQKSKLRSKSRNKSAQSQNQSQEECETEIGAVEQWHYSVFKQQLDDHLLNKDSKRQPTSVFNQFLEKQMKFKYSIIRIEEQNEKYNFMKANSNFINYRNQQGSQSSVQCLSSEQYEKRQKAKLNIPKSEELFDQIIDIYWNQEFLIFNQGVNSGSQSIPKSNATVNSHIKQKLSQKCEIFRSYLQNYFDFILKQQPAAQNDEYSARIAAFRLWLFDNKKNNHLYTLCISHVKVQFKFIKIDAENNSKQRISSAFIEFYQNVNLKNISFRKGSLCQPMQKKTMKEDQKNIRKNKKSGSVQGYLITTNENESCQKQAICLSSQFLCGICFMDLLSMKESNQNLQKTRVKNCYQEQQIASKYSKKIIRRHETNLRTFVKKLIYNNTQRDKEINGFASDQDKQSLKNITLFQNKRTDEMQSLSFHELYDELKTCERCYNAYLKLVERNDKKSKRYLKEKQQKYHTSIQAGKGNYSKEKGDSKYQSSLPNQKEQQQQDIEKDKIDHVKARKNKAKTRMQRFQQELQKKQKQDQQNTRKDQQEDQLQKKYLLFQKQVSSRIIALPKRQQHKAASGAQQTESIMAGNYPEQQRTLKQSTVDEYNMDKTQKSTLGHQSSTQADGYQRKKSLYQQHVQDSFQRASISYKDKQINSIQQISQVQANIKEDYPRSFRGKAYSHERKRQITTANHRLKYIVANERNKKQNHSLYTSISMTDKKIQSNTDSSKQHHQIVKKCPQMRNDIIKIKARPQSGKVNRNFSRPPSQKYNSKQRQYILTNACQRAQNRVSSASFFDGQAQVEEDCFLLKAINQFKGGKNNKDIFKKV